MTVYSFRYYSNEWESLVLVSFLMKGEKTMTLQQLKYVIEVAERGSMSEASKNLFISQPSLSNSIKELENEIHINIFIRSNKGIKVSPEGREFLGYARQVIEQNDLLEQRYLGDKRVKQKFCVSTQHYAFAVNAFVDLIKDYGGDEYAFTLRETKTYEIIDDVKNLRSEIGIIYINEFNEKVISKMLKENNLEFEMLFEAKPHIFVSYSNPLASKKKVELDELKEYPYLSFEQGQNNSFYFAEEILSTLEHKKSIKVSDRATLFNLLIGLNGYTICSGIISEELNGKDIVSVPLNVDDNMKIGIITRKNVMCTTLGEIYINAIKKYLNESMSLIKV